MTNTWLIRRSVASPLPAAIAGCMSSSVCRLPLSTASTAVNGVDHGHADRPECRGLVDKLAEQDAVLVHADRRQRHLRAADLLGRGYHLCGAVDDYFTALVDAATVERDPLARGILVHGGDRDRDRVPDCHRMAEALMPRATPPTSVLWMAAAILTTTGPPSSACAAAA